MSRVWRRVKTDWEAWSKRSLVEDDVVGLIPDGTVVRARLDKKATTISLSVVLGVRRDGQKILPKARFTAQATASVTGAPTPLTGSGCGSPASGPPSAASCG